MLRMAMRRGDDGYGWTLIRFGGASADVLACSARPAPTQHACSRILRRMAEHPEAFQCRIGRLHAPGGEWSWLVLTDDGVPVARSPTGYRDAQTCRAALGDLRLELLASAIGAPV